MELRHLRYFIAVAEERNFTHAARRLFIAQPSLSAAIRQLESRVGVALFERSTRHVALTEAGEMLLPHAYAMLAQADRAMAAMREHARPGTGRFVVGLFTQSAAAELTAPIIRAFREANPHLEVLIRELRFDEQVFPLAGREVDVALLRPPLADERITLHPIAVEPQVVMLPAGHPLAERDELAVGDVLDEPFPRTPEGLPDEWLSFWRLDPHRNGESARFHAQPSVPFASQMEVNELVAEGIALSTAPSCNARNYPHPDVAFIPLRDAAGSEIAVGLPAQQPSPLAERFCETAAHVARELIGLMPGGWLPDERPRPSNL